MLIKRQGLIDGLDGIATRKKIVEDWILRLKPQKVLDIGGYNYIEQVKAYGGEYISIDIIDSNIGRYGNPIANHVIIYDGKNIPVSGPFDCVLLEFVLHHAAENTLPILQQVSKMTKYLIIGEDISRLRHPYSWHKRNFNHQVGGVYRGDQEWSILFEMFGFKINEKIILDRPNDLFKNDIFRMLYFLEKM